MKPHVPFPWKGIYPLIDDDPRWACAPKDLVRAVLAAGAGVLQLRLKHGRDSEALALGRWAAKRTRCEGACLIVNDRFDLADLCGADGVHLGQSDLPPEQIPAEIRARLWIGLSTHTLAQVKTSRDRPIDYIGFGPVFDTRSKRSDYEPRGLEQLRQAVQIAAHPVVAIGGIDEKNLIDVRRTGATGAALISAIANARDPALTTRTLIETFTHPPQKGI